MKKHTKTLSVFLALVMVITGIFGFNYSSEKAEATSSLQSLMDQYVDKYWTKSGGPAYSDSDSLNYHGAIQCKGFAAMIWNELYGVTYIGAYDSQKYYIPSVSGGYEVGKLNFNQMSQSAATDLLRRGKAGDFIQVRRRNKKYGHSMILVSVNGGGITVFDCNSDRKCRIKKYDVSWSDFYSKNSAMSLYRAYYSDNVPSPPTVTYNEDGNWGKYCGITAYINGTGNVTTYSDAGLSSSVGAIYPDDKCTILHVYTNGACQVSYPVSSGTKTAYTQITNFAPDHSGALGTQTVDRQITTYRKSNKATSFGYLSAGDTIARVGVIGEMTQVIYPTSAGYKLGWVGSSELINITPEVPNDDRFNQYCPIKGYIAGNDRITTYEGDFSSSAGQIFPTDYCTIESVYNNGWAKVNYPISGGTKTKYVRMTEFVPDINAVHINYNSGVQITTYRKPDLATETGYVSPGDSIYTIGSSGNATEVLYPISSGYKVGWIPTDQIPKAKYTVSFNANGGTGAPSAQIKTQGDSLVLSSNVPTKEGYKFVGWSSDNGATSAQYSPGSLYNNDSEITLYAVWSQSTYTVSFDSNGGEFNLAYQTKNGDEDLKITSDIPKNYVYVYFETCDEEIYVEPKAVSLVFKGWNTKKDGSGKTYASGDVYNSNSDMTLYAQWEGTQIGALPDAVSNDYFIAFDVWHFDSNEGQIVNEDYVIDSDITVFASWRKADISFSYDTYNGPDYVNVINSSDYIDKRRIRALNKAKAICTIKWTAPCDFATWLGSDGLYNPATSIDGNTNDIFKKGETYVGVPYSMSDHTADDISWGNKITTTGITADDLQGKFYSKYDSPTEGYGSDCSYMVYLANLEAVSGEYGFSYQTTSSMKNGTHYTYLLSCQDSSLEEIEEMILPGDVIINNGHTRMYIGMNGDNLCFFEATPPLSRYKEFSLDTLKDNGYSFYRFKGFKDEAKDLTPEENPSTEPGTTANPEESEEPGEVLPNVSNEPEITVKPAKSAEPATTAGPLIPPVDTVTDKPAPTSENKPASDSTGKPDDYITIEPFSTPDIIYAEETEPASETSSGEETTSPNGNASGNGNTHSGSLSTPVSSSTPTVKPGKVYNSVTSGSSVNTSSKSNLNIGSKIEDEKMGFVYEITQTGSENEVMLIELTQEQSNVIIPDSIIYEGEKYYVTSMDEDLFSDNYDLKSVVIGNEITEIPDDAFYGCKRLKKVVIGKNVYAIGRKAFFKCKKLKSVTVQSTYLEKSTVGKKAFAKTGKRLKIKVPRKLYRTYYKIFKSKDVGCPKARII